MRFIIGTSRDDQLAGGRNNDILIGFGRHTAVAVDRYLAPTRWNDPTKGFAKTFGPPRESQPWPDPPAVNSPFGQVLT